MDKYFTSWWLTYPSEKIWLRQLGWLFPINMESHEIPWFQSPPTSLPLASTMDICVYFFWPKNVDFQHRSMWAFTCSFFRSMGSIYGNLMKFAPPTVACCRSQLICIYTCILEKAQINAHLRDFCFLSGFSPHERNFTTLSIFALCAFWSQHYKRILPGNKCKYPGKKRKCPSVKKQSRTSVNPRKLLWAEKVLSEDPGIYMICNSFYSMGCPYNTNYELLSYPFEQMTLSC